MKDRLPELSIVVPMYQEEDNVRAMYERISDALSETDIGYEIIFVDDGSTDATFEIAADVAASDTRLRVVRLRRNCGQTPAMVAGIDHARGEYIVTMDGDLQNDPRDIPRLLDKVKEGYDLAVGWRENRQDKLFTRKIPSWIANRIIGRITGVRIRDNGCSLKAYRSSVIREIPLYSEMHRFIPAMASLAGSRFVEIPVRHHARRFGTSKYGLNRTYKVILDLVVIKMFLSSISSPMRFFGGIAATALVFAGALGIAMVTGAAPATTVLLGTMTLLGLLSVQVVLWALLAQLLYHTGDVKENQFARLTRRFYPKLGEKA